DRRSARMRGPRAWLGLVLGARRRVPARQRCRAAGAEREHTSSRVPAVTYARQVAREATLVLLLLGCTSGPPAQRTCTEATQMCTSSDQCCDGLSCEPWLG